MKKNLAKKVTLSILAGAVLMSSSVVWAADITDGGKLLWKEDTYVIGYVRDTVNNPDGTVPDGTYSKSFYGVYNNSGNATDGKITISGGEFGGDAYGGYSGASGGDYEVKNNEVNITGGKFVDNRYIYGGYFCGGSGNVSGNKVVISGGELSNTKIYGGRNADSSGDVTDNTVTISGGTFGNTKIFGGYGFGSVKNNTINISGNVDLKNVSLYGGGKNDDPGNYFGVYGGESTPNTLNIGINEALLEKLDPADEAGKRKYGLQVGAWNNNKVSSIAGFDVINFAYVNWNTTKPAVEVTEKLIVNNTKVTVGEVHVASGDTTFAANQKMTLIRASGIEKENPNYQPGSSEPAYIDATIENDSIEATKIDGTSTNIFYGVAEVYKASIKQEANNGKQDINLVLGDDDTKVDNPNSNTGGSVSGGSTPGGGTPQPERNDQVLVLGESRAAAVAFTNQGSELIETGLNALARDNEKDTKVFAAVYGNHSEYETGSHVNVNGWSGIVGIGKTNDDGLTVGAFFENGEGNYSTHNIFTNDYIRGDGEA